ncbi:MAG: right-handed parallel beta-helix repeat-containing protein [Prolixibacteraceae bacterium]
MRKLIFILAFFSVIVFFTVVSCVKNRPGIKSGTINVLDFGAIPDDGKNDIEALRKAAEYCRNNEGSTLLIPEGVYDVIDKQAQDIEYKSISGFFGKMPSDILFKHEAPYVKVLDFTGTRNVTVEATGATLLLHGWYEPVSIIQSRNFLLRGLVIRYNRPPNTVGKIINIQEGYFDMEIDTLKYTLLKGIVRGPTMAYDILKNRVVDNLDVKGKKMINRNTIRVTTGSANVKEGDYCIIRHVYHYRPAIMIRDSKEVTLDYVKIHSQCGMGVVGHRSKNITMNNLQVIPEAGTYISTNTDATHFSDCNGVIIFNGCKFEGQGDDCTNIHGYYYTIYPEKQRNIVEIKVEKADVHALWLSYPDVGDTLSLVSRKSLAILRQYVVKEVKVSEQDWKVTVTFNEEIPDNEAEYFLFNETMRPSVEILNCTVRSHRARPFLIKTNNILIKGNVLQNCTGSGIQIGAEGSWREGGPVKNITIEDNWILDCAYEWGAAISVGNSGISELSDQSNTNIIIRNNVIRGGCSNAISITDAKNVTIKDNQIAGTTNAVFLRNTSNVNIKSNGNLPVIEEKITK